MLTSAGSAATEIDSENVITLTAAVKAGDSEVTRGQVKFCDAFATYCTDIHLLGTRQLTSAGTAVLKLIPGMGVHCYKAVFLGTTISALSKSGDATLTVKEKYSTTKTIAQSANAGNMVLRAEVTGTGGPVSPTPSAGLLKPGGGNNSLGTTQLGFGMAEWSWKSSLIPTAGDPCSVAAGDFNGDGIPDLALTICGSASVAILLGDGHGAFTQTAISPLVVGGLPISIAVGDFNGDGILDLAVVNSSVSGSITILLGNGDGTFTQAANSPIPVGDNPVSIVVGDFNYDGIADLAVANDGAATDGYGTITILLGDGNGMFTQAVNSPMPVHMNPWSLSVADFNGDGIPDLAVLSAMSSGTLTILQGNGDGTFTEASSPASAGVNPDSIEVADFNGDGIPDLALANSSSGSVTVLLGNRNGTFTPAANSPVQTGSVPSFLEAGHFNFDGNADLAAVSAATSGAVTILLGNGDGTLIPAAYSPVTLGPRPLTMAAGDFNGDGLQDLAVVNTSSGGSKGTVTVLLTQFTEAPSAIKGVLSTVGTGARLVEASNPGVSTHKSSSAVTPVANTPLVPAETPTFGAIHKFTSYSAFGDSITAGWGLLTTPASYPRHLAAALKSSATVRAISGDQACDVPKRQVFPYENPGDSRNLLYTMMIGTNDVNAEGPGPYEAVAALCRSAAITWLTTSSSSKFTGSSFKFLPVGWTLDQTYAPNVVGLQSSTNGSAANWAVATSGGPIAIWYRIIDANGGLFTYSVDGGAPNTVANSTHPAIATMNGTKDSVGVAIIAGVSGSDGAPVSHIVTTTVASPTGSGNIVSILGLGTTMPEDATDPHRLWESGVPFQLNDANAARTSTYNADNLAETITLGSLGFGVSFVDIRSFLLGTPAEMVDALHPNELGHLHILTAFYNAITVAPGTYLTAQYVSVADATPGANIFYTTDGTVPTAASMFYSGPITVSSTETILAIAIASGYSASSIASALFTITPPAAMPAFSIAPGTYVASQLISLSDSTPGATIFYTTTGSTPSTSSTIYSGPITVSTSEIIQAIATANGYSTSAVASATYTITPPAATPAFNVASSTYTTSQTVSLSNSTPGTTMYYTTNGTVPTASSMIYSGPITVSSTETIQAIATASGYSTSAVASATYAITPPAATPVFSAAPGTYIASQTVSLSDSTPGATIFYTTTGSTPDTSSTVYSGSITVSTSQTIHAIAIADAYSTSAIASASFTITPPAAMPAFNVAPSTYTTSQTVSLSDSTPGTTMYYTTNGAVPTASSMIYSGPITVSSTETIQAIATAGGYSTSAVASATYTITPPAVKPAFNVAPGTYTMSQTVTLSDSTPGATIFYTTTGSTPSASSTLYSGPITVSKSVTIQAIAIANAYSISAVASASFAITPPAKMTPTVTITPSSSSITTAQALFVGVAVGGTPMPIGKVTLVSGGFNSVPATLNSGSATINIPAGSLATGTDTLTANYTGDENYSATNGTATVVITTAVSPSFTISGAALTVARGATAANTSTITVTPVGGFKGTLELTAAVTSSPSGALSLPTLSFGSTSPMNMAGPAMGTAILSIATTAATTSASNSPQHRGDPWYPVAGASLACVLLFGIPPGRRNWRTRLVMLALLAALTSGAFACGGNVRSTTNAVPTTNSATTIGTYTVTVSGKSGTLAGLGTISLTVQ